MASRLALRGLRQPLLTRTPTGCAHCFRSPRAGVALTATSLLRDTPSFGGFHEPFWGSSQVRAVSSSSSNEDPFQVLGVSRDATQEEVKAAYRRLALKWHPDRNPQNPKEAEAQFKKVSKAYAILSDPEARERYMRYGTSEVPFSGPSTYQREQARDMTEKEAEELFRQMFGNKPLQEIIREVEAMLKMQQLQMKATEESLRETVAKLQIEAAFLTNKALQERHRTTQQLLLQQAARKAMEAQAAEEMLQIARIRNLEQRTQAVYAMRKLRSLDPVLQAENKLRRGIVWGVGLAAYFWFSSTFIMTVVYMLWTSLSLRALFFLLRSLMRR